MKRTLFFFVAVGALMSTMISCSQSPYKGYDQTESGLYYKFYERNEENAKPQVTDILTAVMMYSVNDSILFNDSIRFMLEKPSFAGDFYEGVAMMSKGDSASFICKGDSTFIKMFKVRNLPDFIKPETMVKFDFRLVDFITRAEYDAQMEALKQKMITESQLSLEKYLLDNNVTVKPTESGLYYVELKKGSGRSPKNGETVQVHYTGTLLDGTKFDSSIDRGKPIEFVLGEGRVIKGWDEGIALMRKGGKAQLIIPYHLAYGERGTGPIAPFSPLVFDVELVNINK